MSSDTPRRSILIADDEVGLRDLHRFTLEPLGFEVVTAADGQEALELFRLRRFDLVVLDVNMPKLTGPEALAHMRELHPTQPAFLVSGRRDWSDSAERIVFKPFDIDEFLVAIDCTLKGKS